MKKLNTLISFLFTKTFYHKAIAYGILIFFLIFFKSFALIFFLIFIFSYLFYSSASFIKEKIDSFFCSKIVTIQNKKYFKKYFSLNFIIIVQYIIFILIFVSIVSAAIPKLQTELIWLSNTIPILDEQINNVGGILWKINTNYTEIGKTLEEAFTSNDYNLLINVFNKLKNAWILLLEIIFALVLSFVFLIDRKKLQKYLWWIKKSNFSFLFYEYKIIFDKIIRSFWLILKAQSLIALVNATLTVIGLFIIWTVFTSWIWFPYLLTLWLVVFIFGFVPVVWVFLSSIPILIVWFSTGWIPITIAIIFLILIIHIIEAYYLNPKIVSNFLELPVSLTFLILFVWEHLFWIAGLLVWVSLFYFLMGILKDINDAITKKHRIKTIEKKVVNRIKKSES
jgi:predicted PurR-regulated permease PerM